MKKIILGILTIGILLSCNSDDSETDKREFVPREVSVGIKSGTNINAIFEFINQFDHIVDRIISLTFTSDLPTDNLQYVIDFLNEKNYTNDGKTWFVTGYLHYQTNQVTIFPKLFDMNNKEYQNDWLNSMQTLKLKEKHNADLNSGVIRFIVPEGKELEWKNRFENYSIVEWSRLNYIVEIVH